MGMVYGSVAADPTYVCTYLMVQRICKICTGTYVHTYLYVYCVQYTWGIFVGLIMNVQCMGVWLLCPLADCPPDGWSSMDELLFVLSRLRIVHCNDSSPACKRHPKDSPPVVRPLDPLRPRAWAMPHVCTLPHACALPHACTMHVRSDHSRQRQRKWLGC